MHRLLLALALWAAVVAPAFAQSRVTRFTDPVPTGSRKVQVRNTTAGASNFAGLEVGNDASDQTLRLLAMSSTWTPATIFRTDGAVLAGTRSGGLTLAATDAAGDIWTHTSGIERSQLDENGKYGFGAPNAASSSYLFRITGSHTSGSGSGAALFVDTTVTGLANSGAYGLWLSPTLVEASTGTHSIIAGAIFNAPTVTGGAASVTTAANVYINGAPSASGAANYALVVNGVTAAGDGSAAAPALTFLNDPDTGLFRSTTNQVNVASNGVHVATFTNGPGGGVNSFILESIAHGAGSPSGASVVIGRNTSGNGAPGMVQFVYRTGAGTGYVWADTSGNLRIHTAPATETSGDTIGTVVGTQTSTWESKDILGRETDGAGALAELLQTPIYRFSYKSGAYSGQQFVGITTRTSPLFGMDQGKSFNPVTAFGVTVLAVQELERRVRELEARQ
jgi:hypothetical protein